MSLRPDPLSALQQALDDGQEIKMHRFWNPRTQQTGIPRSHLRRLLPRNRARGPWTAANPSHSSSANGSMLTTGTTTATMMTRRTSPATMTTDAQPR